MAHKVKKQIPTDIEGLKDLLDVVSRAKRMWESTFDAIRDPVMIIGSDYQIERANIAAADRSGHPIRELVGRRCYEAFAHRQEVCPHCPLAATLQTGKESVVVIDSLMTGRDFEVNSYPHVQDTRTEVHRVVHHYRDVTEPKQLQRKLIQSEKMAAIGLLAGGVAHEINNPLAGIIAFTQLLQKEASEGQVMSDLKEIEAAAMRCKKIVEDLLAFARPRGEGEVKTISVTDEMEKVLPLARLNLRHLHVTLATEFEPDIPPIKGNGPRLQQVFLNLMNNAAQSMRETGGTVTVRIRHAADTKKILVEVIDQGCGIPPEDLSKIFDPFFSTKEHAEGTGLGLSICYSIVSEHGGKIEVKSEVGKGSLFRVVLPSSPE